jgi:hypothetical protein
MTGFYFIEQYKHIYQKGARARHGEDRAQKQGITKLTGMYFQDSL